MANTSEHFNRVKASAEAGSVRAPSLQHMADTSEHFDRVKASAETGSVRAPSLQHMASTSDQSRPRPGLVGTGVHWPVQRNWCHHDGKLPLLRLV